MLLPCIHQGEGLPWSGSLRDAAPSNHDPNFGYTEHNLRHEFINNDATSSSNQKHGWQQAMPPSAPSDDAVVRNHIRTQTFHKDLMDALEGTLPSCGSTSATLATLDLQAYSGANPCTNNAEGGKVPASQRNHDPPLTSGWENKISEQKLMHTESPAHGISAMPSSHLRASGKQATEEAQWNQESTTGSGSLQDAGPTHPGPHFGYSAQNQRHDYINNDEKASDDQMDEYQRAMSSSAPSDDVVVRHQIQPQTCGHRVALGGLQNSHEDLLDAVEGTSTSCGPTSATLVTSDLQACSGKSPHTNNVEGDMVLTKQQDHDMPPTSGWENEISGQKLMPTGSPAHAISAIPSSHFHESGQEHATKAAQWDHGNTTRSGSLQDVVPMHHDRNFVYTAQKQRHESIHNDTTHSSSQIDEFQQAMPPSAPSDDVAVRNLFRTEACGHRVALSWLQTVNEDLPDALEGTSPSGGSRSAALATLELQEYSGASPCTNDAECETVPASQRNQDPPANSGWENEISEQKLKHTESPEHGTSTMPLSHLHASGKEQATEAAQWDQENTTGSGSLQDAGPMHHDPSFGSSAHNQRYDSINHGKDSNNQMDGCQQAMSLCASSGDCVVHHQVQPQTSGPVALGRLQAIHEDLHTSPSCGSTTASLRPSDLQACPDTNNAEGETVLTNKRNHEPPSTCGWESEISAKKLMHARSPAHGMSAIPSPRMHESAKSQEAAQWDQGNTTRRGSLQDAGPMHHDPHFCCTEQKQRHESIHNDTTDSSNQIDRCQHAMPPSAPSDDVVVRNQIRNQTCKYPVAIGGLQNIHGDLLDALEGTSPSCGATSATWATSYLRSCSGASPHTNNAEGGTVLTSHRNQETPLTSGWKNQISGQKLMDTESPEHGISAIPSSHLHASGKEQATEATNSDQESTTRSGSLQAASPLHHDPSFGYSVHNQRHEPINNYGKEFHNQINGCQPHLLASTKEEAAETAHWDKENTTRSGSFQNVGPIHHDPHLGNTAQKQTHESINNYATDSSNRMDGCQHAMPRSALSDDVVVRNQIRTQTCGHPVTFSGLQTIHEHQLDDAEGASPSFDSTSAILATSDLQSYSGASPRTNNAEGGKVPASQRNHDPPLASGRKSENSGQKLMDTESPAHGISAIPSSHLHASGKEQAAEAAQWVKENTTRSRSLQDAGPMHDDPSFGYSAQKNQRRESINNDGKDSNNQIAGCQRATSSSAPSDHVAAHQQIQPQTCGHPVALGGRQQIQEDLLDAVEGTLPSCGSTSATLGTCDLQGCSGSSPQTINTDDEQVPVSQQDHDPPLTFRCQSETSGQKLMHTESPEHGISTTPSSHCHASREEAATETAHLDQEDAARSIVKLLVQAVASGTSLQVRIRRGKALEKLMIASANELHMRPASTLCFSYLGCQLSPQKTSLDYGLVDGCTILVSFNHCCVGCASGCKASHGQQARIAFHGSNGVGEGESKGESQNKAENEGAGESGGGGRDKLENFGDSSAGGSSGCGGHGSGGCFVSRHASGSCSGGSTDTGGGCTAPGVQGKTMPHPTEACEHHGVVNAAQSILDSNGCIPSSDKTCTWERYWSWRVPAVKDQLEARWQQLASDQEALELLQWRFERCDRDGALPAATGERLRDELDALIADCAPVMDIPGKRLTSAEAEEMPAKRRRLQNNTSWHDEIPTSVQLRLALNASPLPSPFLAYMELHGAFVQEVETRQAIERWLQVQELQRKAIWSMIAHRAHLQDKAILSAIDPYRGGGSGLAVSAPMSISDGGAFTQFLAERMSTADMEHQTIDAENTIKLQRDFFNLPDRELAAFCDGALLPWQCPKSDAAKPARPTNSS